METQREIKFRAWDTVNKLWLNYSHYPLLTLDGKLCHFTNGHVVDLDKSEDVVLMQYTGLKDRYGKEIYEGDIVQEFTGCKCVVEWFEPHTGYKPFGGGIGERKGEDVQVIGNIHDDPELVEGGSGER